MKNVVYCISIIAVWCICSCQKFKTVDTETSVIEDKSSDKMSYEELDSALKDWPFPGANGNWIPSRDGLENSDTIVDGFPYNHI